MTAWVATLVTLVLGGIGLYFTNSIRHRFRQDVQSRVADKRFEAYAALWAETKIAAGIRVLTGEGGLSLEERKQLADSLTTWYYDRGNGMLLSARTRKIFLEAKHNLVRGVDQLTPKSLKEKLTSNPKIEEIERGKASLWQVSLLRASMRADFEIYSGPANPTGREPELDKEAREFLIESKVNPNKRPWRPPLRERLFRSPWTAPRQLDA